MFEIKDKIGNFPLIPKNNLEEDWEFMGWSKPDYDRTQVNQAGNILLNDKASELEKDEAFRIMNNWRTSHNFPLNTFQVRLRRVAREIDDNALVAQRIKRLSSIKNKLLRFNQMKLSQMQDIAGCRVILDSLLSVNKLSNNSYKQSDIKHKLLTEKNYISNPKDTGYRGIHLIYGYYSDRKTTYNTLKIEIQIRTLLQHAWATAVETVDTFTRQFLKGNQGEEEWKRFFALMGTAIAKRENTRIISNTPEDSLELKTELIKYEKQLRVKHHLENWGTALKTIENIDDQNQHYFLLELDSTGGQLSITGYKFADLNKASDDLLRIERDIMNRNADAVLVSVESIEALRRAFPNYYLDTKLFVEAVDLAIQ